MVKRFSFRRGAQALVAGLVAASSVVAGPALARQATAVSHLAITVPAENGRQVRLSVYVPRKGCRNCTLVIFSHGAFSTPGRYDVLLNSWAAHGLVIAAPLHTDSEEYPDKGRYPDSRATRLADWQAVDTAMQGARIPGVTFSGKVVAAGHSYGALIAEIAGGALLHDKAGRPLQGRTPAAVIAISPPGTLPGVIDSQGYSGVARPTLVVTGTADVLPGFIADWHRHLDSYEAIQPGLGYAAVFAGMDHNFNGAYCRPDARGGEAAVQVARLNGLVVDFIDDALRGKLPDARRWSSRGDPATTLSSR